MALPTFVSAGSAVNGAAGTISPGWGASHAADDIGLLFVETASEAVSTPAGGWAELPSSPQENGVTASGGTRLTVFWKRATSGAESAASVTAPTDHAIAQILVFRGCKTSGDPWNQTTGDASTASATATCPAVTTTAADCLVVYACADSLDNATGRFSAWAAASLANVAMRSNVSTNTGNGGGFSVWTGEKATAGNTGTGTATISASSRQGRVTIALEPASGSPVTVTPGVGAVTITGFAPSIGLPQTVTPGVGAVTITGFAPTINTGPTVLPGVGSLVITGFAPSIGLPRTVLPGVGAVVITGFAPTISTGPTVLPGAGELVITGFAPTVQTPQTVTPGVGALTITGFAPTVQTPRTVTPGAGELVITGFAPTVSVPVTVQPGVGALVITGFAPIVSSGPTVQPGVCELVITGYAPIVEAISTAPPAAARTARGRRKNRRRQDQIHLENLRRRLEEEAEQTLEELTAEVAAEMAPEEAAREEEQKRADYDAGELFRPVKPKPPAPKRPPPINVARFTFALKPAAVPAPVDLRARRAEEEDEEEWFIQHVLAQL